MFTDEYGEQRDLACVKVELAFRIAEKWRHRLPTAKELMEDYGMHKATAYRWLRAMKAARGIA